MAKDKNKVEYILEEEEDGMEKKIKKIKKQLKACQKEKEEYLAGWQRAKADLINYKKEQEQKISDYYKFANQGLIAEILMVLDSFEGALKHSKDGPKTASQFGQEAIEQLYNQLKNILKNQGLEEIKAKGEKFNPELHESMGEIKGKKPGFIVEEVQKGYKLNNKVIRPSRVKISK